MFVVYMFQFPVNAEALSLKKSHIPFLVRAESHGPNMSSVS